MLQLGRREAAKVERDVPVIGENSFIDLTNNKRITRMYNYRCLSLSLLKATCTCLSQ